MDDLLKTQSHKNCMLALPEGLKDLMWDISREVLRAQPQDLNKFIADYLSALLVTRDNLSLAAHICGDICNNICHLALNDELRYIGLSEEMTEKVEKVIEKHFAESKVIESNLLVKLVQVADLQEDQLPEIQIAVRKAYLRYQANRAIYYETSSSDSEMDEVDNAVRHTLHLYRHSKPSEEQYNKAAVNIQTSYRAYGVRRRHGHCTKVKDQIRYPDLPFKADGWHEGHDVDVDNRPRRNRGIRFDSMEIYGNREAFKTRNEGFAADREFQEIYKVTESKPYLITESSSSLAGSYLDLPKYKPYSIDNCHDPKALASLEEVPEKEHANIDYTLEEDKPAYFLEDNTIKPEDDKTEKNSYKRKEPTKKTISFHEIPSVIDLDVDGDCVSDWSVEEDIRSDISAEVDSYVAGNDDILVSDGIQVVDRVPAIDDEIIYEDDGDIGDKDYEIN